MPNREFIEWNRFFALRDQKQQIAADRATKGRG